MLRGHVRTSPNVTTAYFGVRLPGITTPAEIHLNPSRAGEYQQLDVPLTTGATTTSVTAFTGFWGLGSDGWIQFDDIVLLSA